MTYSANFQTTALATATDTALIVGLSVGGTAAVLLGAASCYCCWRRRCCAAAQDDDGEEDGHAYVGQNELTPLAKFAVKAGVAVATAVADAL